MTKLFSFDIGHASIGWAVFDIHNPRMPELEGCGAVIFPADDCLASQRRDFRRQRRHIRSTRVRIARMKELLAGMKVLSQAELDEPGGPAPWKLAAEVLCGHRTLSWRELWDVLRWYAHNRGYDGNRKWSRSQAADPEDTEKEKNARDLMLRYNAATMAETICARLQVDPRLPLTVTPSRAYKTLNAAFPRDIVVSEVRCILEQHANRLPSMTDAFIEALCAEDNAPRVGGGVRDRLASLGWKRSLPSRYVGGLLFGQAVPRFDNRIIGECPVNGKKLPLKSCREFREFRWAMIVANIRVSDGAAGTRPLVTTERRELTAAVREAGGFTASQFRKAVAAVSKQGEGNTAAMMTDPNADEALILDPPVAYVRSNTEMKAAWPMLSPELRRRILGRMNRQKRITWGWIAAQQGAPATLADELVAATNSGGKRAKTAPITWETLARRSVGPNWPSGRAPYSREVMRQATNEVMQGRHPAAEGGVLFMSEERIARERAKTLDELTNNHLIRHRLRMLDRLVQDMVKRYAGGDPSRVVRCVVEVVRDLAEFSGKTNKEITAELNLRLKNFNDVAKRLKTELSGVNVPITAGLIRKACVADDLGWKCPYTREGFDAVTLARGGVDLDHVIPRSQRASDSLDSLVVTFPAVNRWKGNRTARQFVADEQGKPVPGAPHLTIQALSSYDAMVATLSPDEKRPTRYSRGQGSLGDKMRRWNRKQRMTQMIFAEQDFTPRDLTITSHLTRLACRQLERSIPTLAVSGSIISIPGSVTGVVRKAWRCLGCLASAAPLILHDVPVFDASGSPVIDAAGAQVTQTAPRPKGEIREITHLHHALDAAVLGYTAMLLPRDGALWERLVTRKVPASEVASFRRDYAWTGMLQLAPPARAGAAFRLELLDLPTPFKRTLTDRLQERRVVRHVPADMGGARLELNSWRVVNVADGRVRLRQRSFDPKNNDTDTGARKRVWKTDEIAVRGVVGLQPGKLSRSRAALVISDNFGVAVLDSAAGGQVERFRVIPFHQVKRQIHELTASNNGVRPLVIRNGDTIRIQDGNYKGIWRVFSVKNARAGVMLDLGQPDTIRPLNKTEGHKINVKLASLLAAGLTVAGRDLTGP